MSFNENEKTETLPDFISPQLKVAAQLYAVILEGRVPPVTLGTEVQFLLKLLTLEVANSSEASNPDQAAPR